VYLSAKTPGLLAEELRKAGLAGDVPILMAHKVGWPDEKLAWTTLDALEASAEEQGFTRQTVFLIMPGEKERDSAPSRLYSKNFHHGYRK